MMRNLTNRVVAVALLVILAAGCASKPAAVRSPGSFSFGLIGDLQYTPIEEKHFPLMLKAMDREALAFVVHVGDFKNGGNAPCTDALFATRLAEFNQSKHPLIYTPGDNEWVDCRRESNGSMIPLERLDKLRQMFFNASSSLGQTKLPLTLQPDTVVGDKVLSRYRENAMWVHRGVVFATLNIQGSNDNVGFDAINDAEQLDRTRANLEWLKAAIRRASADDIISLALFMQANPGFEAPAATVAKSAYVPFLKAFEVEAEKFGKPVLFAHGDSHIHRVDRPYQSPLDKRTLANVTRVEGYGTPNTNWVRITVEPANPKMLFAIESGGFVPPK